MSEPVRRHVVFGTGPVGMAVMEVLRARGDVVRMVSRSGRAAVPDDVELLAGDAAHRAFSREAAARAAVVYQCASPPYHRWLQEFPRLQAGVVEGAAAAGARLVVIDDCTMYGPTDGKPVTEKRPYLATSRKGVLRARLAEEVMKAHDKGRVEAVIGRASDLFGPGVTTSALGARVFGAAVAGDVATVLGDPDLLHTYTYVPDIGRSLVALADRPEAAGRVWHLPSPPTITTREVVELVYRECDGPPQLRAAPRLLLRFVGLFNPSVRELVEMLPLYEEPFVVDHSRYAATFGDDATPLDEAVAATVEWFRREAGEARAAPADAGEEDGAAPGSPWWKSDGSG